MELTIDCKIVYGFDLKLSKTFHYLLFLCRRVKRNLNEDLLWFAFLREGSFGKDDLPGGGVLRRLIYGHQ